MKKFRSRIKCDACGREYTTIKHKKRKPARCKKCNSIQIRVLNSWEVS